MPDSCTQWAVLFSTQWALAWIHAWMQTSEPHFHANRQAQMFPPLLGLINHTSLSPRPKTNLRRSGNETKTTLVSVPDPKPISEGLGTRLKLYWSRSQTQNQHKKVGNETITTLGIAEWRSHWVYSMFLWDPAWEQTFGCDKEMGYGD